MSREIKFRCWYDNKMHKVVDIDFAYKRINLFCADIINFDENILMQFTGLHDKNGKEIYEGDIVKVLINGIWYKGQVIYEHSGFIIDVTNNKNLEFGRRGIIERFTEVIGNIYKNKELLEN